MRWPFGFWNGRRMTPPIAARPHFHFALRFPPCGKTLFGLAVSAQFASPCPLPGRALKKDPLFSGFLPSVSELLGKVPTTPERANPKAGPEPESPAQNDATLSTVSAWITQPTTSRDRRRPLHWQPSSRSFLPTSSNHAARTLHGTFRTC